MRRARIKAVATLPVRRKATQDAYPMQPAKQDTEKPVESSNFVESKLSPAKEKAVDAIMKKQEIATTSATDSDSDYELKNNALSVLKVKSPVKTEPSLRIKSPVRTEVPQVMKSPARTGLSQRMKFPVERTKVPEETISPVCTEVAEKSESLIEIKVTEKIKPITKSEVTDIIVSPAKTEISQRAKSPVRIEISQKVELPSRTEDPQRAESPVIIEITQKMGSPARTEVSQKIESPAKTEDLQKIVSTARTDTPQKVESSERVEKSPARTVEGIPVKPSPSRSCFTRPTPRLDGGSRIRRNSMQGSGASASESEDDCSRRSSVAPRIRTDSICSTQSYKDSSNTTSNAAKLNLGHKRRMIVSESARKLAEARREFLLKHENKAPDKAKLTMYDLIYYNPVSNPMKPKPVNQRSSARKLSVSSTIDKNQDEDKTVDEPSEMPVPQVKVGPNGQLIIDEQSLVIDQYKAQENIDRSDIIVDEDTNGSGFYKRRQKSKDWSKWETLKFYKALNTYGTDFLLMQSIFPKRTRQELKLKYKKEEKINTALVEKALRYQEFDTDALEKDLACVEENEKKETEQKKGRKRDSSIVTGKRKRCKLVNNDITCDNSQNTKSNENSDDHQSGDEKVRITITKQIRKRKRKKNKISVNTDNIIELENSDSEPEVYKATTTRSGRISKRIRTYSKLDKNNDEKNKSMTKKSENKSKKNTKGKNKLIKTKVTENQENKSLKNRITKGGNEGNATETSKSIKNENKLLKTSESNLNSPLELNDADEEKDSPRILNHIKKNKSSNKIVKTVNKNKGNIAKQQKSTKPTSEKKDLKNINSDVKEVNALDEISDDIASMSNLKPGSLVVLKKDSVDKPGKATLQVYVVRDDYDASKPNCKDKLLPINVSADVLQTVTNCINKIDSKKLP